MSKFGTELFNKQSLLASHLSAIKEPESIALDDLTADPENFYSIDEVSIERLAENIRMIGLTDPITVIKKDGKYVIKSGERRFRAYCMLRQMYGDQYNEIPAFVYDLADIELNISDEAKEKLLVVSGNEQRHKSEADIVKEVETYMSVFDEMKHNGQPVSGKLRDRISALVGVSPATVARVQKVVNSGTEEERRAVENGEKTYIEAANEIVARERLESELQGEIKKNKYSKIVPTEKSVIITLPDKTVEMITGILGAEKANELNNAVYAKDTVAKINVTAKKITKDISKLYELLGKKEEMKE